MFQSFTLAEKKFGVRCTLTENLAVICQKIILKSNGKHVPSNGVVRAKNKCGIRKCLNYGEVTGNNVTGTVNVFKKMNNFKKTRGTTPTVYIVKWNWQAYSTLSFWL